MQELEDALSKIDPIPVQKNKQKAKDQVVLVKKAMENLAKVIVSVETTDE